MKLFLLRKFLSFFFVALMFISIIIFGGFIKLLPHAHAVDIISNRQLVGTQGANDWQTFTVNSDTYALVANQANQSSNSGPVDYTIDSYLYKWMSGSNCFGNGTTCANATLGVNSIQSIGTSGARDWQTFTVNSITYALVANYVSEAHEDSNYYPVDSYLYKWMGSFPGPCFGDGTACADSTLGEHAFQTIRTAGAIDWQTIMVGGVTYALVASQYETSDPNSNLTNSYLYKWNPNLNSNNGCLGNDSACANSTLGANAFQAIKTKGASDWETFTVSDVTYALVANYSLSSNVNVDSYLYKWMSTSPGPCFGNETGCANETLGDHTLQSIRTSGAKNWKTFTDGSGNTYALVANYWGGGNYMVNSYLYKWMSSSPGPCFGNGTFCANTSLGTNSIQSIKTAGAIDWQTFTISGDVYALVANQSNSWNYFSINSYFYKWMVSSPGPCFGNGTSCANTSLGTNALQAIPTSGAGDWETFTVDSIMYALVANYTNNSFNTTINSNLYSINTNINTVEFHINNAATTTASETVTLNISTVGQVYMEISNTNSFMGTGDHWEDYAISKDVWALDAPEVNGGKTVYIRFKDSGNNISATYSDSIDLEKPRLIENVPVGIAVVLYSYQLVNAGTSGQTGILALLLKSSSLPVVTFNANFSANLNWSSIIVETNDTKSLFHVPTGFANLPGVADSTFIMYVPKGTGNSVGVCPGATELSQITTECSGYYILRMGDSRLSTETIGGVVYWKISGLTGTGVVSLLDTFGLRDVMTRMQAGVASDHTIYFGTENGLITSGDTIEITFPGFNLSGLDYSDMSITDNIGTKSLGSGAVGSTWGVLASGTKITFTAPPSNTIVAGSMITVKIGKNVVSGAVQMINPSSAGSYQESILITNIYGTETGDLAVAIVDSDTVDITGYVTAYIYFDIDTSTDNRDCEYNVCKVHGGAGAPTGTNYTVDLGELNSISVNKSMSTSVDHNGSMGVINAIYFDLSTNAISGAVVTVISQNGGLLGPGGSGVNLIASITDGQNITNNDGKYGYNLISASSMLHGAVTVNTNCNIATKYCGPVSSGTKEVFNTQDHPIDSARVRMDIAAGATYVNNPGVYTDTLTFVATSTF